MPSALAVADEAGRLTADDMVTGSIVAVLLLGLVVLWLMKRWYGA